MTSSSNRDSFSLSLLVLTSALGGVALSSIYNQWKQRKKDPEKCHEVGHGLVWGSIGGAMNASMIYVGDRLKLYSYLRDACAKPGSFVTAIELAETTGLSQRWLREWLAQQAAMGILKLLPGDGDDDASLHYRLPIATGDVLANPESKEYDVAMIQGVPALVSRAKTMLPEAFLTGLGRPYDEPDVAEAIDRQHTRHIRDTFIPELLPKTLDGKILQKLETGGKVADLGCGAGVMLISLAKAFPKSTFHGYEVSKVALEKAATNAAKARLSNLYFHDANDHGESLGECDKEFDLVVVYDVLHDSTHPADLIAQVKKAMKPEGHWLLADIPSKDTLRENIAAPGASAYFGFSTCLCMSCALSVEGGAGLGTLGFSIPVAKKMLKEGGFDNVEVIMEKDNARWFLVY